MKREKQTFIVGPGMLEYMDEPMDKVFEKVKELTNCTDAELWPYVLGYLGARIATDIPEHMRFDGPGLIVMKKYLLTMFDQNYDYGVKIKFHTKPKGDNDGN